ncbi:MAG: SUMF1/EgtB/PvdO family nonheme iron enzyme [Dysgonamonadaceae bacterium]|jgi:formylglycine-generating enzyme required for sulfatase activity|nr:SUMF1/EgtB/PvdO family nonheme iron enzyme [Dysgonamonadaceae bacterium]
MIQQEFQQRYTYNPLTDKLGEGGFGSVFKAYDTHRDRWVAVKVAKVIPGMETVRLRKEVEMVIKLPSHPNIAYYEECFTFPQMDGEYDFGILQYYELGNLNRLLRTGLPPEQRTAILIQLLNGLDFLHQYGIIHRDLKPQNILMVKRGQEYIPKITDFGISKRLDINKSSVFSNSIAGAGTLAYASPEQLSGREIRKNTDLWSFGVIVYQAFTGSQPFTTGGHASTSEAGRVELFRQINLGNLPDAVRTIPTPWQTLVRNCLKPDPAQRIKDVSKAKVALLGNDNDGEVIAVEEAQINTGSYYFAHHSGHSETKIDRETDINIPLVYVSGGTFTMGCTAEQDNDCNDDEKPAHQVTVDDFYIGRYEVTQVQWKAVMGSNPSYFKGDNLPVEKVSWDDVQEFICRLNQKTGKNYRLPTEAEWEFAARGGTQSRGYKYSGSNNVDDVAWYEDNSGNTTHPVGQKQANELGLYDMSGNVWEWCSDWYGKYSRNAQANLTGYITGFYRIDRGGSWNINRRNCRVSNRSNGTPDNRYSVLGFRLASSSW